MLQRSAFVSYNNRPSGLFDRQMGWRKTQDRTTTGQIAKDTINI